MEAERIITVIDTTINKIELVAILADAQQHMISFEKILPPSVLDAVREHARIEQAYVSQNRAITPKGPRHTQHTPLADSTRSIMRMLMKEPALLTKIKAQGFSITPQMSMFIDKLRTLRQLVFDNLLTTAEEESDRQVYLAGLLARERKLANEVKRLETELDDAQAEHDKELEKNAQVIEKLRQQTSHIQTTTADVNRRIEKESQKR